MFKMAVLPVAKQRICRMRFDQLRNLRNLSIASPAGRFFDPKNAIAFNKLFGVEANKPLLLSFLNSIQY